MNFVFNPFTGNLDNSPRNPVTITASEPSNPQTNDLWVHPTTGMQKVYSGSAWVSNPILVQAQALTSAQFGAL